MSFNRESRFVFEDILPPRPDFQNDPMRRRGCLLPREIRMFRWRQLNQLHSLLYNSYDSAIDYLNERQDIVQQLLVPIIVGKMGPGRKSQAAASAFSKCRFVESSQQSTMRKMAYDGPISIMPASTVESSYLWGFVWKSPVLDAIQTGYRLQWYGNDVAKHEEALIIDHIEMYRDAIAVQQALISELVDFLSLNKTLDRLNKCLTNLKVPKKTIKAIAEKVSELDCLWKDSIPADWLSTPPTPLPKPNKDCIIKEIGSSRYMGAQDDADCYITIQAWPLSSQKQQEQQSCAIVSYNAEYAAAQRTHITAPAQFATPEPSASHQKNPSQGFSKQWGTRILGSVAAAGAAVAGLVADRSNPTAAAGYRSWLSKGLHKGGMAGRIRCNRSTSNTTGRVNCWQESPLVNHLDVQPTSISNCTF